MSKLREAVTRLLDALTALDRDESDVASCVYETSAALAADDEGDIEAAGRAVEARWREYNDGVDGAQDYARAIIAAWRGER